MNVTIVGDIMKWGFVNYSTYHFAYEYIDPKDQRSRLVSTRDETPNGYIFFNPSGNFDHAREAMMACNLSREEHIQGTYRYFGGVYTPYHLCILCMMKARGLLDDPKDNQLVVTDDTNRHPAGTFG